MSSFSVDVTGRYIPEKHQHVFKTEIQYYGNPNLDPGIPKMMDTKEFPQLHKTFFGPSHVSKMGLILTHEMIEATNKETLLGYFGDRIRKELANEGIMTLDDSAKAASMACVQLNAILDSIKGMTLFEDATYKWTFNPAASVVSGVSSNKLSDKSRALPGTDEQVGYPCDCYNSEGWKGTIWTVVQHLNDNHKWTRERIADWLDELHDTGQVDIEFKVKVGGEE